MEEADQTIEKLVKAKEEKAEAEQKLTITKQALRRLAEEHRTLDNRYQALKSNEVGLTTRIEKLNLENDMTTSELKNTAQVK